MVFLLSVSNNKDDEVWWFGKARFYSYRRNASSLRAKKWAENGKTPSTWSAQKKRDNLCI